MVSMAFMKVSEMIEMPRKSHARRKKKNAVRRQWGHRGSDLKKGTKFPAPPFSQSRGSAALIGGGSVGSASDSLLAGAAGTGVVCATGTPVVCAAAAVEAFAGAVFVALAAAESVAFAPALVVFAEAAGAVALALVAFAGASGAAIL